MAQDKVQVKIPRQIRLKTEFFIGFGMEELIKTLIVGAVAGVIASLVKGNNNFSMIDMIKNIVKYETMQKEYRYERGDFNNKTISKK